MGIYEDVLESMKISRELATRKSLLPLSERLRISRCMSEEIDFCPNSAIDCKALSEEIIIDLKRFSIQELATAIGCSIRAIEMMKAQGNVKYNLNLRRSLFNRYGDSVFFY